MNFNKTLLVLTHDTNQRILSNAVDFCKNFGSKMFVLFVIETNRVSRLASLTHQKIDSLYKKIEEDGWTMLYLVEDDAVENGVWTSLHLEDGNIINIIKKYIESYDISIVVTEKRQETKKIFVLSPVPVVGL